MGATRLGGHPPAYKSPGSYQQDATELGMVAKGGGGLPGHWERLQAGI